MSGYGGNRGRGSGSGGNYRGGGGGGRGGRGGGRNNNNNSNYSDSGRGRGRGGGGGRHSGGGGRSSGGRGRSSGGRGGPPAKLPTEALSNMILADVTPNFRFYQYGLDFQNKQGKLVDSRGRRMQLFVMAFYNKENGWLSSMLTAKELISFQRGVFFEGSFLFSSKPIPGLEDPSQLPIVLVGDKSHTTSTKKSIPISDNGDIVTVTNMYPFVAPTTLKQQPQPPPSVTSAKTKKKTATTTSSGSSGKVKMDSRCSSCTSAFQDIDDLMAHCKITGHAPVYESSQQAIPASNHLFLSFCNVALQRAMGERMARWGRDYIHPSTMTEPKDRNGKPLGVHIFRAFSCEFGLARSSFTGPLSLCLTVDLRAKVIRTKSLLHNLADLNNPHNNNNNKIDPHAKYSPSVMNQAKRLYKGQTVICKYDKRCYIVVDLKFDQSANSLPIPDLNNMSHADYFIKRKGLKLDYPNAPPMIAVLGRNNKNVYLPPEMVCINELDPFVKMQLPMIASFPPSVRHEAMEEMRRYLVPKAQKTRGTGGGLLPAIGIVLKDKRIPVKVDCLPMPVITAAGVPIPPERAAMWAPNIAKANYKVHAGKAIPLHVVLVYNKDLSKDKTKLYNRVRDLVNQHQAHYRFGETPYASVPAGDDRFHWGAVEKHFSQKQPSNVFVLDFSKPKVRSNSDPAYAVIKHMLAKSGYLSQFVNFKNYDHARNYNERKSMTILQGVARQVLSKCGVRVWWVNIPRSIPLPAVFVGVDVFHAPRKYDLKQGKPMAKESVAAIIVQLVRSHTEPSSTQANANNKVEIFSLTERRQAGKEMELGGLMNKAVSNALKIWKVHPMSCVVWRDGVGMSSIPQVAQQEIPAVRSALALRSTSVVGKSSKKQPTKSAGVVPLSYIVVQKRIATKFLSMDGKSGMPCGALVTQLQGPEYSTFYINGNAPHYSTAKPARFVIATMDAGFGTSKKVLSDLSWALCHDYPNWTGPIKLPAPVQCAHKLAELAGCFSDCGDTIDAQSYANKIYFL